MCGTEIACARMQEGYGMEEVDPSVWMTGTAIPYVAMRCPVLPYRMVLCDPVLPYRMVLCDVRYCHTVWCYALSGTAIPYGGIVYGAMQCPRMVLCGVRYWDRVWCYAVSGTGIAYGAM
eukprot:3205681-Rhodomonas_salina.1